MDFMAAAGTPSEQPADEVGEDLQVGAKNRRVGARLAATGIAEAHAGGDLHLVDVEACDARLRDQQGVGSRRRRQCRGRRLIDSLVGGSGQARPTLSTRLGGEARFAVCSGPLTESRHNSGHEAVAHGSV